MPINRRSFLRIYAALGLGSVSVAKAASSESLTVTPAETEGPFYPVVVPADRDADLSRIAGHTEQAQGEVVMVTGRVLDERGHPLSGVTLDIWQANAYGRYRHPFDRSDAPLDEHFQGWAIIQSDTQGQFRFKTIVPGAYAVSSNWIRPPHIHFKVSQRGFEEVTTQMYFDGHELNSVDRLLQSKNSQQQRAMVATLIEDKPKGERQYQYDIVLKSL